MPRGDKLKHVIVWPQVRGCRRHVESCRHTNYGKKGMIPRWSAVLALFLPCCAHAGEFNSVLKAGDEAPAWVELPGVDDKRHSLAELKDKPVVVVVFTCNSCPVAELYEDRIIAFARKHAEKV